MIFEFDHLSIWKHEKEGQLDVMKLKRALSPWQNALDGNGGDALYMENNGIARLVSVFGNTDSSLNDVFLLQGTLFIYQG